METERIALNQRERDRLKVLHEVKQKSCQSCQMSKVVRNVPFLTSIEMSPFFVLYLFLLLSAVALEKFLASKPQERRSSSRSTYGIPVFLSCWLGPERSPA